MPRRRVFKRNLVLDEPVWAPLERVARLARECDALPSFHEGEFMYMAAVRTADGAGTIHLYKHRDTRRYLNLDEAGHAYEYCPPAEDSSPDPGHYRVHRSIAEAIEHVELWLFEREPAFFRSFPPDDWPTETSGAPAVNNIDGSVQDLDES